jgi:hypothetical protein
MLRFVVLVRTDVLEEISASFMRVTAGDVPRSPILVILMKEAPSSSKLSVLRRAIQRKISEDAIPSMGSDIFLCRIHQQTKSLIAFYIN